MICQDLGHHNEYPLLDLQEEVRPIEVSTDLPFLIAHTEAPLPWVTVDDVNFFNWLV